MCQLPSFSDPAYWAQQAANEEQARAAKNELARVVREEVARQLKPILQRIEELESGRSQ
jgi:hypothetical protein